MKNYLALFLLLFMFSCSSPEKEVKDEITEKTETETEKDQPVKKKEKEVVDPEPARAEVAEIEESEIDPGGPATFITKTLAANPDKAVTLNGSFSGWNISKANAAALMELIDSEEPASVVIRQGMSQPPPAYVQSTIGTEALFILDAYMTGQKYPHYASSIEFNKELQPHPTVPNKMVLIPSKARIQQITTWWANNK